MYKYFTLLFVIFININTGLLAQEIIARLDLGKKAPKPYWYEYSPSDEGLVTLGPLSTVSTRNLGIVKYDANLEVEWRETVLEQNGRKNVDFATVIGTNILVFVSEFSPKEKVIKTYFYRYDLQGNITADKELIAVVPNQREQKVALQYALSPNKKRLLCYKNPTNRMESEELLYYVFDENGELILNGDFNLKYPDNKFVIRKVKVSNQGNVYVLGKFYKVTKIKDPDDFKYVIFRQDVFGQTGREITIDLGEKYITDVEFKLDREENIFLAGFYSNNSSDRIIGTIFQKLSTKDELLINATEQFDDNFLSNYLSIGQINKGRELRNFYLNDIILRSDGGVLLMAEKFYITYHSYRDFAGYWVDREVYHYEDVILTSIDNQGQIEWHAIVDKSQVGQSKTNLSYFDAIGKGKTFLFYEYKPRSQGFNIYYNTIAMDGQVSNRIPLIPSYDYGDEFYPTNCTQINNQEAIMMYVRNKGRVYSIMRVKLE